MNSIGWKKVSRFNWVCRGSLVLASLFAATTGCQTPSASWSKAMHPFGKKAAKAKDVESAIGVPERMVVIWKDSVYESPTEPPTRGFGGRFYFYDRNDQPIRIDGELVIYGFDDTSGNQKDEADKKFVFRQEKMADHFSVTPLGPSYSVWVPWDKIGGPEASISLIPVFRAKSGEMVRGDHTVAVLQGPNSKDREFVDSSLPNDPVRELIATPGVQQIATGDELSQMAKNKTIAHVEQVESAPPMQKAGAKIRTTTISLPNDTAMRLQQASRRITIPQSNHPIDSSLNPSAGQVESNENRTGSQGESPNLKLDGQLNPAIEDPAGPQESSRGVFGLPGSLK